MGQILMIALVVFFLGAILLLERRCLGKTALIQPLVLCLLAGVLLDAEEVGLWLGISLQLLSIGQSHYCNWVLASIICSATLAVMSLYGVAIEPGTPASMVILCTSILIGILADFMDRKLYRGAAGTHQEKDLWKSEEGVEAFARLIYKRVFRGFLFGGTQSIVGVTAASLLAYGVSEKLAVQLPPQMPTIVSLIVPAFGIAVTLGSLSGRRYPFFAGIGVVVSLGFWMVV